MCYMLDTNIFDALAKGQLSLGSLPSDGQFRATRVQLEELKDAKHKDLRAKLLATFTEIIPPDALIPAAFAFDTAGAGFDEGIWRADTKLWTALLKDLDDAWEKMPRKKQRRSKKRNNAKDCLIAEAAKFNNCTLLTRERNLAMVAEKHGVKARLIALDSRIR
jgi:predicted nucleic acid-binding protein